VNPDGTGGPDGATAIDADEAAALIPSHLATRAQLNAWEHANIVHAHGWVRRAPAPDRVLQPDFVVELHRRMFDRTWRWAGRFRRAETNIGVPPGQIAEQLHNAVADARHWIDAQVFDADGCATLFHHRLVWIHPFPNGNGRWGRLVADTVLRSLGRPPFSWGANTTDACDPRARYLHALRLADRGDVSELFAFVRS